MYTAALFYSYNMKLLTFLFVLPMAVVLAQKPEIQIEFKNTTPNGTKTFAFTVGAHPQATDLLDTLVGEREIPSLPLPGNIFYVWAVAPTNEVMWFSPKEYRKLLLGQKHLVVYDITVAWTGGSLSISQTGQMPELVDSAWIVDGYSDFPNNFLSVKLQPGAVLETPNPSVKNFNIMVWYNATSSTVSSSGNARTRQECPALSLYPNPAHDILTVATRSAENTQFELFNIRGEMQPKPLTSSYVTNSAGTVEGVTTIRLEALPPGVYLLNVTGDGNTQCIVPFVKE